MLQHYIYEGLTSRPFPIPASLFTNGNSRRNPGSVAKMPGLFCSLHCDRHRHRNFDSNSSLHQDAAHHLVRCILIRSGVETSFAIASDLMSTQFMMLFRGTHWSKGLSPQEIQKALNRWNEWMAGLVQEGKIKSAQPLVARGKIVSGKKKRIISDGPFAESKEAIAGYFLLEVKDLDEAVEIAKEVPTIEYGVSVEVRPVAPLIPENLEEFKILKHKA
jgi:hypothetical protein